MTTVVERFAADYFVLERLTEGRQALVRRQLRLLEAHAGGAAETLDDTQLRAFLADQLTAGLHVNTVRKHLLAIKPFYKWCWRNRIVDAERWMRIDDVSPPRGSSGHGRPRPYKIAEVRRFWDELDDRWPTVEPRFHDRYVRGITPYRRIYKHAMHLQVQAVVGLALFNGLRRAEIRHASINDIHPDNEFVVVRGKSPVGERQGFREVPYTAEGRRMVGEWIAFRENVLRPTHDDPWLVLSAIASPNNKLNPSHPLNPIGEKGWRAIVSNVGRWELHRFRHTCATEWLRAGVDLEQVQQLLGHASLQQTLRYAELVREDLARGVRRAETDFVTAVGRRNQQLTVR
jgi:site-specific recombinase XerD